MQGLYLAMLDMDALSGYTEKLFGQLKAFHDAGVDVNIISLSSGPCVILTRPNKDGPIREVLRRFKPFPFNNRIQIYIAAAKYILSTKADLIYIRHFLTDPFFITFLLCIKLIRRRIIILSEVPTYPYDHIGEFNIGFISKILLLQDKIFRKLLRYFYNRIVSIGYSGDIFRVKTISIGNGIDADYYKINNNLHNSSSRLRIIGVGHLKDYHGYDRLIEAVKRSLSSGNQTPPIEFHIVSPTTPALIRLRHEVDRANINSHIIFHGEKVGADLDKVFEQCHLAIASLAWHRVKVERHSNLKTREYMARGIPFLYAGTDDQLPEEFKYACKVALDETPIGVDLLFKFAKDMLLDENRSANMRRFAIQNMSWSVALTPVVEYLKSERERE